MYLNLIKKRYTHLFLYKRKDVGVKRYFRTSYSHDPGIIENKVHEFDAITAVIVGGTSFLGGIGTVTGALIGSIIVGLINNILNLLHVSTQYQLIVKGLLIAIAVIIDIKTKENKKSK